MSGATMRLKAAALPSAALLALVLGACASGDDFASGAGIPGRANEGGRIQQCKAGDVQVDDESQCLQDDAACYAIASGAFCTGERGASCPAGSSALASGASCPPGARCFEMSESLSCAISVQ